MSTDTHDLPGWLDERIENATLYLSAAAQSMKEQHGRELSDYLRHRLEGTDGENEIQAVVLDLQKVDLITSPAIGALIVIHKRMSTTKRRLALINLSPMLIETLTFLKLDKVLVICRTPRELEKALG